MQRRGRSGHAQFRVVVQDSRFHPTSGRVVAYVGNYDPHTKAAKLDSEKISKYLQNGAQPSDRVAKLLSKEGIKLPDWFRPAAPKTGTVRNADKRRSTRPEQPKEAAPKAEASAEVTEAAEPAEEVVPAESAETTEAQVAEEPVAEHETAVAPEAPAEETAEAAPSSEAEVKEK